MEALQPLDVLRVSTVLEDYLDQLAILGCIMPASYEGRPDAGDIVGNEVNSVLQTQKKLELRYEELMSARSEIKGTKWNGSEKIAELRQQIHETAGDLKRSNHVFSGTMKQSPLSPENLKKVQADRQFVADIAAEMLEELQTSGTFNSLLQAVQWEKEKKNDMYNTIIREEDGRKQIKALQKQLQDIKKDKESEVQNRNELIAHLKDQLQELKAKTNMEGKYVRKNTEHQVFQTQKKCHQAEKELEEEVLRLRAKIDEETRVHQEIENFLRKLQVELEEKLEYWMEKYDKDTDAKQSELNLLKASKASDLARLQELAKQYRECEQVVIEDRIEKEKERQCREQEEQEVKSCIKIQAWWRGTMVRKGIGSYKKPKKGEKGKGKSKGKKAASKKKK
ncbi:dynein regulatory complex protein 9 isoform X3 [Protopterus annectens]|nr:dynein regulatory complex protein 9 isoform X3 [Protopterus annectens]